MLRTNRIKSLAILCIVAALIFAGVSRSEVNGQADPFSGIKDKLSGISMEEKEILQNLFTLVQEIEAMEAEEKKLAQEIKTINQEIKEAEAAIAQGELAYDKKQESLKRVLQSYQRMGPGSFMEILLDSDSLGMFLQRINILRDLTRNTGELLDQLEASGEKLSGEKAELSQKLALLKDRQKQSREALKKKMEFKAEKEEYLTSLNEEREQYQRQLADIEQVWNELKPLFSDAAKEFSRIMQEGSLPTGALRLTFNLLEIRGAIDDKVINKVVSEQSSLPAMMFAFHPGKVEISLPDKYLVLSGTFVVLDGHTLKFQAQEGSFYGMKLTQGSLEELFGEGDLVLDIEPLLAGNVIHALEIKEGYIELISKLDLF